MNTLARHLREAGGTVSWVLPAVPEEPEAWATAFYGPEVAAAHAASGGSGSMADRLWAGLDAGPGDVWVEKTTKSAFFPGACSLASTLRDRDVDTVLVTGTVTSVCCESSARDAATLGFRVVVVADACADVGDDPHNASLRTIYRSFGDVRPASELVAMLAGDAPA